MVIALAIGGAIASGAGYLAIEEARCRSALAEAKEALERGRYARAQALLAWVAGRRPGDGEAAYRLGIVELALGHPDAARGAWGAVPEGSAFAGRAAVERARLELRSHRFAGAEPLMARALGERGPHATEAAETLVHLLKIEGRFREARRLVRARWDGYPDAIGLLREMAHVDSLNPYPFERARSTLATAAAAAPEDDRVWLGLANLATRTGRFDEADRWLGRCEARRLGDEGVGRGRLQWALAIGDEGAAGRALRALPTGSLDPEEVLRLRAWFAGRSGDARTERAALYRLHEVVPDDLNALERLAELAHGAGEPAEAARLRIEKAGLDAATEEYRSLLFLPDAPAHSDRLAGLADRLHRRLEAILVRRLALARRPGDLRAREALARAEAVAAPAIPPEATLAALLADLRPTSRPDRAASAGPVSALDFTDDAAAVGLDFSLDNGKTPLHHIPETTCGGVGLLDYDGDGWLDVYCVQGGEFPPGPPDSRGRGGDRLFRNRGDGTFEDTTGPSGIGAMPRGYGHGVAVGDYDDDGRPDVLVTRWRAYALYHNEGGGTFRDATEAAGLGGDRDWPTSAAFADLDGDGDLDLYVCHYLRWDAEHPDPCPRYDGVAPYQYCHPQKFPARPDHLFRNDGGRFVDVTAEAGIVDRDGRGLGVVAADFDGDGRVDLFVANDTTANFLFRNLGGMRFEEVAHASGVASSADGVFQASMGVACGDADGDGLPDLAKTNFYGESTTLYRNLDRGAFVDATTSSGLAAPTRQSLGFGVAFLDADADGRPDLATANGHINDLRPEAPWKMPAQLLLGAGGGRFVDAGGRAGPPWGVPRLGRGLAVGDLDNDGRADLLIVSQDTPLAYLHNRTRGGRSVTLRLVGRGPGSNRDAVGARVALVAGGRRQVAFRSGGGSFQSASDARLHIGVGAADRVDSIEVTWPSGRVDRHVGLAAGGGYLVVEGDPAPARLAGFRALPPPAPPRRDGG